MDRLMMALGGVLRRAICRVRGGHGPDWEQYRPHPLDDDWAEWQEHGGDA